MHPCLHTEVTDIMNQRVCLAILIVTACCSFEAAAPASSASPIEQRQSQDKTDTSSIDIQPQSVRFPSVGVKLVRPKEFEDAENFHGFQQPSTQSSIMVLKIPGPFSETTRGFTAAQLRSRGITLHSKTPVNIDGKTGMLLSVTQTAYGREFAKWILVFGDADTTRMVTATFPKSSEATLSQPLKAAVLSTTIDDTSAPTDDADTGFARLTSTKLKLTSSIGKALLYTQDGIIPAKSPADPLFIAAPSIAPVPMERQRQFAIQRLFQTEHTQINTVTANREITIDGLDGYEIVADGEDIDSGTPLRIYQVILYDDRSYILMQGIVGATIADQYLPEFKSMARSLTRNPRGNASPN